MMTLERIFVSPGHDFVGRHGEGRLNHGIVELQRVECVAGRGLRGDRFFDHRPNFKGQVTLFAAEIFGELCAALGLTSATPAVLRRNLIVSGMDLNALVGARFRLQGVLLEGVEECRPCYWMDEALKPGAEAWLQTRGGLRCRILSDGWLAVDELADASGPERF